MEDAITDTVRDIRTLTVVENETAGASTYPSVVEMEGKDGAPRLDYWWLYLVRWRWNTPLSARMYWFPATDTVESDFGVGTMALPKDAKAMIG